MPPADTLLPMYDLESGFGALVLCFILFMVFVWLILFHLRPSWVLLTLPSGGTTKTDINAINYPRLFWWSALIALIVIAVLYLVRRLSMCAPTGRAY